MRVEEIAIHCSIFVATIIIGVLLFQVLKYLNSKPLGLQIVLDDLTKDAIIILGLTMTYTWITWIKLTQQYDYYLAKIIIDIGVAFRVALIVQALTVSVTRYLFVFHFELINNVAERKIKMVSRIFVTAVAVTCATFDDWTTGKKFLYLTENQLDKEQVPKSPKSLLSIIVGITSSIIIAHVQARIAYSNWKYPEMHAKNEISETYNLKMISVVTGISLVVVIIVISFVFAKILLWKSLLTLLCIRIIVLVMILLLIYSNKQMFVFVKRSLLPSQIDSNPSIPHNNPTPDIERNVQEPIQQAS